MGIRTRRCWIDGSAAAADQQCAFVGRRDEGRLESGIWRRDFGNGGVAGERETAECRSYRGGTRQCARPEDRRRHSVVERMAKIVAKQCRIYSRADLRGLATISPTLCRLKSPFRIGLGVGSG